MTLLNNDKSREWELTLSIVVQEFYKLWAPIWNQSYAKEEANAQIQAQWLYYWHIIYCSSQSVLNSLKFHHV